ncbi:hypothetical protein MPR_2503 [Myroides profundi]|nr:hypothetical protein MPR_2503 [Myroides profundi]
MMKSEKDRNRSSLNTLISSYSDLNTLLANAFKRKRKIEM